MNMKKELMFTLESGGWNSVFAESKSEARRLMLKEYGDRNPTASTLKTVEGNMSEYRMLLASF